MIMNKQRNRNRNGVEMKHLGSDWWKILMKKKKKKMSKWKSEQGKFVYKEGRQRSRGGCEGEVLNGS